MRKAFTLLELLVATMLLAMLVTILTMIFNQSSIAWTIGVASLTGMDNIRQRDAILSNASENMIRRDLASGQVAYITSVWGPTSQGEGNVTLRERTVSESSDETDASSLTTTYLDDPRPERSFALGSGSSQSRASYIVGVTSWGPDGEQGTWDDITTMPEEVVK